MLEFETDQALTQRCETVLEAARDALKWYSDTSNDVVRSKITLERTLRKSVVQAGKLLEAAKRRTCVGVFGASQAGKSFLISALARKGEDRLMALFGDKPVDFITKINPEGGKESTGVVTRFTCDKPVNLPDGHPVVLGLLSEIDVVRIMLNSYVYDLVHNITEDDDGQAVEHYVQVIEERLQALTTRANTTNHLSLEDVYELEDYIRNRLASAIFKNPLFDALRQTGFWSRIEVLLPKLDVEGRVEIYSTMWEGLDVYTVPCREMLKSLESVGHSRTVYAAPNSLFEVDGDTWNRSSDRSIVNVSTLNGIGDAVGETVSVCTENGTRTQIERTSLTGLIAELNIVVRDQPFAFFDHTDLLDFPGARTRKPVSKVPSILDDPNTRTENFLRGKVAYLFQRYCDEQELNAMILTVGPSNQEVADLARMIEEWIETTHGKTPAQRSRAENALFFVFSKFDTSFERGAGKEISSERWATRIEASLLKPFGGAHSNRTDWVNNWTPGKPFDNSFWIRNPNLRSDALFQYEGDEENFREVGFVSDDVASFVDKLFDAYISCADVQRHFEDPKAAWDPCMALNDGGISRLATALAPVCRPELKRQQVAVRAAALSAALSENVAPFYVSGDIDVVRREKVELSKQFMFCFADLWRNKKFGHLINALLLDQERAFDVYISAERATSSIASTVNTATSSNAEPQDDIFAALGLENTPKVQAGDAGEIMEENQEQGDIAQVFVSALEELWIEQVTDIAHNPSYMEYLAISGDVLVKFANELSTLARRLGIFDGMTNIVRQQYQYKISRRDTWVWRQVAPACNVFNDFLSYLGCYEPGQSGPATVSDISDNTVSAFTSVAVVKGELILEDMRQDCSKQYLIDYLNALQHQVKGNAGFQIGFVGNQDENRVVGKIIDMLNVDANAAAQV